MSSARASGGNNKDKQAAKQPIAQATLKNIFLPATGAQRSKAIAERMEKAGYTDMMYRG
jgi:hypothetical protein